MKLLLFLVQLSLLAQLSAQPYAWNTLATGAGGWMTGLDIHPSGNPVYARSDVGSAYRYNPSTAAWDNIVNANTLPASDVYWNRYSGVLSLVSAPSNVDRAYLAYYDGIYTSTNQGDTWVRTNFPTSAMPANNDESKLSGERLAVDPANDSLVYFGSINTGLWRSTNAGASWEQVPNLPSGLPDRGIRQVLFHPAGTVSNRMTQELYVTIDGVDVYRSEDAGTTWTQLGLSTTYPGPIFLDSDIDAKGHVYCVGRDSSYQTIGIQKFDGQAWTSLQNNGTAYYNVAIDPLDSDRIVALSEGFDETALSTNASSSTPTWTYPDYARSAADIPWLQWFEGNWFNIGELVFDPVVPDKLWIADGVGIWNVNALGTPSLTWVSNARQQEHLVSNDLIVTGDGLPVTAHWDRPLFVHETLDQYPKTHQPTPRFNSAWDLDASPKEPNFLVGIIEDHRYCCYDLEHRNSGYSSDGGRTWTRFATMPDSTNVQGIYGNIAVAATDTNNVVWLPTGDQAPYYTTNLGQTWAQSTLPNDQGGCCLNFNFVYKKGLTADRVAANTFYLYNWENGSIYVSEDGGATWAERTALQDYYGWNAKLTTTPDHAGHLWYSHGAEQDINLMQPLKRSTDGGRTWSALDNTAEVLNLAIGKALPGASYPTLFIQGRVEGTFGYWMSADEGSSWRQLGTYPQGIYDVAKVLEADPFVPSRLYIGFPGNGFVYGQDDELVTNPSGQRAAATDVQVFPNPTTGRVRISSDVLVQEVEVFNSLGKLVQRLESPLDLKTIDLQHLPPGAYTLRINQAFSSSFIKQ